MIDASIQCTQEEMKKRLDYSFHSAEPDQFICEFRERRERFVKALPAEQRSLKFGYGMHDCRAIAQYVLENSFFHQLSICDIQAGFTTISFLKFMLQCIASGEHLNDEHLVTFHVLQKRFEVNRRIFDRYSPSINKTGERFTDLTIYGVFSLVLMLMFLSTRRFTYLNTALKINDLIVISGWEISEILPIQQCLGLEKEILGGLGVY